MALQTWLGGTMNAIRKAGGLVLGAALMAGCSERNVSTGPTGTPTGVFSADVAAGKTSVVIDIPGAEDKATQAYEDIVSASITKNGGTCVVVMDLAAQVPDNPPLPSSADMLDWVVAIDKDPTSPAGYDFTKNTAAIWEFVIEHRVYRSGFTDPLDPKSSAGILVDRKPLLTGGQAIIIPIQFTIEGAQITWVVDAALLGDPSRFQWAAGTSAWQTSGHDVRNGYNQGRHFDQVPNLDLGASLAAWPQ